MNIEELNSSHAAVQALVDRFAQATPRQRAEMVLRAVGGKPHKSGWLLPNQRLIRSEAAEYWATDLNAIANAERDMRIAKRRYAVFASEHHGWTVVIGDPEKPLVRLRAASERDARALAVVLYGHIREPLSRLARPQDQAPAVDPKVP
jgi:hypothetical protein